MRRTLPENGLGRSASACPTLSKIATCTKPYTMDMNDDQILMRGGSEHDIEEYANRNGADLQPGPWNDPSIRWVCEYHPTREMGHRLFPWFWRRCGGAGMPDPITHDNHGRLLPYCARFSKHFSGNFEWCIYCRLCRRCGRKHGEYARC